MKLLETIATLQVVILLGCLMVFVIPVTLHIVGLIIPVIGG